MSRLIPLRPPSPPSPFSPFRSLWRLGPLGPHQPEPLAHGRPHPTRWNDPRAPRGALLGAWLSGTPTPSATGPDALLDWQEHRA